MKSMILLLALTGSVLLTACGGSDSNSCSADADSAVFTLAPGSNTELRMAGTIDCTSNGKLQSMLSAHPIDTLVMTNVPGSVDDEANIAMAKVVSAQNLSITVPEFGLIASGGVDLFLAGASRVIGNNATFGVHSWATGDGTQGITVYNNDPGNSQHQLYITYYDQFVSGLKDGRPFNSMTNIATDFYVYTLQAAPASGLHCMTPQELVDWGIVTNTTDVSALSTVIMGGAGSEGLCTH